MTQAEIAELKRLLTKFLSLRHSLGQGAEITTHSLVTPELKVSGCGAYDEIVTADGEKATRYLTDFTGHLEGLAKIAKRKLLQERKRLASLEEITNCFGK